MYVDAVFREEVRPTDDVDVVIEIVAYKNYAAVEEQLRALGFVNDTTSKVICRYQYQGIIVDIIPTNEKVLGFSNKWYASGFQKAIDYEIDRQHTIKIFPAPYFIASKLEAFKGRGKNDGRTSTDFEDIVFVIANRKKVWEEFSDTDNAVKVYLKKEFSRLLDNQFLNEWIAAHLAPAFMDEQLKIILQQMNMFIKSE